MNRSSIRRLQIERLRLRYRRSWERWERRVQNALWVLAAVSVALAALAWWQLLGGAPWTPP